MAREKVGELNVNELAALSARKSIVDRLVKQANESVEEARFGEFSLAEFVNLLLANHKISGPAEISLDGHIWSVSEDAPEASVEGAVDSESEKLYN